VYAFVPAAYSSETASTTAACGSGSGVALAEFAPVVDVAVGDRRFCLCHGLDPRGVVRLYHWRTTSFEIPVPVGKTILVERADHVGDAEFAVRVQALDLSVLVDEARPPRRAR